MINILEILIEMFGIVILLYLYLQVIIPATLPVRLAHLGGFSIFIGSSYYEI